MKNQETIPETGFHLTYIGWYKKLECCVIGNNFPLVISHGLAFQTLANSSEIVTRFPPIDVIRFSKS